VEASDDGGSTWTRLADTDGYMVDDGSGDMALTGEPSSAVTLHFDLSDYAGQDVTVRLRYVTDMAVQWAGWWADDFDLVDGATTLFSDDCELGAGDWETNGFVFVPKTDSYPLYYLATAASTAVSSTPTRPCTATTPRPSGRSTVRRTACPVWCCGCVTARTTSTTRSATRGGIRPATAPSTP